MSYGNYPDLGHVKKILVVKLRHLGDVLLTTPVFATLKEHLPGAEIDAYIYAEGKEVLADLPEISQLILYDRKWKKLSKIRRFLKELSVLKTLRKNRYDMVINLTEGDRGAIVAKISGAGIRVGFDPEGKGMKGKKEVYTHLVKNCKTPRHTVEKQLDALRKIGVFPASYQRSLRFAFPKSFPNELSEKYELKPGGFTAIHAVSRWRFKCLPPRSVARIIEALEARGEKVVLTGGPGEEELVEQIAKHCPGALNLSGKTTIKELGALYSMARGLITVDSLSLHLSSALRIPTLAIFGPTSEENWGPWQNFKSLVFTSDHSCRPCGMDGCGGSKMSDCLFSLNPEKIAAAYWELIDSSVADEVAAVLSLNSLETKKTE